MSTVDFNLTAKCNHVVDGLQYWGFDSLTQEQNYYLENDSTFKNKFLKKMAYRVCPRCQGKGYYSDIFFQKNQNTPSALSQPVMVRGQDKLIQDLNKFLTTITGDNIFHDHYGVGYQQYIGTKILPSTIDSMKVITLSSLDYMAALYREQKAYQNVDPSESFSYVDDVDIYYDPTTPVAFFINVTLVSEAGEQATTNVTVNTIPRSALPDGVRSDIASFTRMG